MFRNKNRNHSPVAAKLILCLLCFFTVNLAFATEDPQRALDRELVRAVAKNDKEAVKKLLEQGANINDNTYIEGNSMVVGNSAFLTALDKNNLDMAEFLVENGADVNFKGRFGFPFSYIGSLEAAKFMVAHGAELGRPKYSILADVIRDYNNPQRYETLQYLIENGADASYKEGFNEALRFAIEKREIDFVKLLVQNGADVKKVRNAVKMALKYDLTLAQYLVDNGADINEKDISNYGTPPLISISHYITYSSNSGYFIKMYKFFIDNNADLDAKDNGGRTALMGAVKGGGSQGIEEVRLLVENGADVNAKDNEGKSVLMYISGGTQPNEKAKYLVERGADINAVDNNGKSVIMYMIEGYQSGITAFLIEKGVNAKGLYYIENPAQCKCGKCEGVNGRHMSFQGQMIKEGILVAKDTGAGQSYQVCVCDSEAFSRSEMLPVKDGMSVRQITAFCACGDSSYDGGF